MFDLSGITFVKVNLAWRPYWRLRPMLLLFQAARLVSPLRDAWTPGGEDDRETQQTVARMLAEIKQGGEEAGLTMRSSLRTNILHFL